MSSSQQEEWNSPVPPDVSVGKPTEGLDNISRLPDCILTSILFLIPFKDSVRTSILSSRWRNLWKLTPLRLDDSMPASSLPGCPWDDSFSLNPYKWNKSPNLFPLTPNQLSFFGEYGEPPKSNPLDQPYNSRIARILSSTHDGPVHSLRLSGVKGFLFQHTVAHIVQTVIKRNICELTLDFRSKDIAYQYQPTLCLFSCNSLQKLTLTNCVVPKPTPLSISPNLKELNLMECIRLDPDFLQTVLNSCASLQTMQLVSCEASSGPCIISVRSHSLRKFVLSDIWCLRLKELIIEDAPNLENLMLGHDMIYSCDVKILHARKLRVLGFISTGFKKLQLGRDYFVQQDPNKHTIQAVRGFWNEQGSFEFLDYYLKEVIIKGFRGDKAEVEFLRFLVVNGKLLDKIILLDLRSTSTTIDSEEIQRKLCFHKRASKDLELVFSSETQCNDHVSLWKPLLDKEFISIP